MFVPPSRRWVAKAWRSRVKRHALSDPGPAGGGEDLLRRGRRQRLTPLACPSNNRVEGLVDRGPAEIPGEQPEHQRLARGLARIRR